jgi:YD repeat-containing protein
LHAHKSYATVDTTSNQIGRLTTSGNADARAAYQYDALGRPTATEHDFEGNQKIFTTTYGYSQGAPGGPGTVVVARGFPAGEQVQYGYDASGAQVSITAAGQPIISAARRNVRGQTVELDYGDSTVTRYTYRDGDTLRLSDIVTTGGTGTLQSYHYDFDAVGNITNLEDHCDERLLGSCQSSGYFTTTYGYDSLRQLTSMATGDGLHTFGYDAAGNLTNHDGVPQAYVGPHPHAPSSAGGE